MKTYAVYFKPVGALATWPLASDTLFGAVCWGIRALELMDDRQLTDWLEVQKTTPAFAFSHAFPSYVEGKTRLRFYPRPSTFQPKFDDLDTLAAERQKRIGGITFKAAQSDIAAAGKQFKRLDYVSESILHQIIAGNLKPLDGLRIIRSLLDEKQPASNILCTDAELKILPKKLFDREAMQHNHIDRMGGATVEGMLFYREEIFFAPGTSLWALLRADEKDMTRYIQPALRYLADTGLGADRTSGKGQFDITIEPAPVIPVVKIPGAMMTLSHYLPGTDEFDPQGEPLSYTLKILRPKREQKYPRLLLNGQKSAPVYKQALRVFEPGSVFPFKTQKELYGRLARLTPPEQEPVFQSGTALMLYL